MNTKAKLNKIQKFIDELSMFADELDAEGYDKEIIHQIEDAVDSLVEVGFSIEMEGV